MLAAKFDRVKTDLDEVISDVLRADLRGETP